MPSFSFLAQRFLLFPTIPTFVWIFTHPPPPPHFYPFPHIFPASPFFSRCITRCSTSLPGQVILDPGHVSVVKYVYGSGLVLGLPYKGGGFRKLGWVGVQPLPPPRMGWGILEVGGWAPEETVCPFLLLGEWVARWVGGWVGGWVWSNSSPCPPRVWVISGSLGFPKICVGESLKSPPPPPRLGLSL